MSSAVCELVAAVAEAAANDDELDEHRAADQADDGERRATFAESGDERATSQPAQCTAIRRVRGC
jgi:hypothetical protein